jgi:hypothetical protein
MQIRMNRYQAECYDSAGYCPACDDITTYGIEPDARGCECDACGGHKVMGLEEAALMGKVIVNDD